MGTKTYRKFKGVKKCIVVEILEGDGTEESPMEINSYVICNGEIIGFYKNHEVTKLDNEYK